MVGITNPKNARHLAHAMAPIMSKTDKDGIGYVAINNKGEMFSEKWLKNNMAFFHQAEVKLLDNLGEMTDFKYEKSNYMSSGVSDWDNVSTVLMHTRHSTNKVCIENTHPFIIGDTALVHNGVISNHDKFRKEISSCDSEAILTQYIDHEVGKNSQNIDAVSSALDGWMACGILNKTEDHGWIVDVFRRGAQLYACYIPEVGGVVFSTSDEYIKSGVIACKFTMSRIFEVKSEVLTRFNPFTGERMAQHSFCNYVTTYNKGGNSNYRRYEKEYDDEDYYANGYNNLYKGQQEATDSKYTPKFVFGIFTEKDCDELETIYEGLPDDEKKRIDDKEFDDRYKELDLIRQNDIIKNKGA
jgi:hypothetical protein